VVNKVALGQVFLRVLRFSPVGIFPSWLSVFVYHLGDAQSLVAVVRTQFHNIGCSWVSGSSLLPHKHVLIDRKVNLVVARTWFHCHKMSDVLLFPMYYFSQQSLLYSTETCNRLRSSYRCSCMWSPSRRCAVKQRGSCVPFLKDVSKTQPYIYVCRYWSVKKKEAVLHLIELLWTIVYRVYDVHEVKALEYSTM
jgi:hypothetical protein